MNRKTTAEELAHWRGKATCAGQRNASLSHAEFTTVAVPPAVLLAIIEDLQAALAPSAAPRIHSISPGAMVLCNSASAPHPYDPAHCDSPVTVTHG